MILPCKENTCAVIVTFFPETSLKENLKLIRDQVGRVIIVDNASGGPSKEALESLSDDGIVFIWNDKNLGVAAALNQGCQYAVTHNYVWVVTFDQDTRISDDLIDFYAKAYSEINDNSIAIMGCNYTDPNTNELAYKGNAVWEYRNDLITSGSLILLEAYKKVGGFREDFFIDVVDFDFCQKCFRHQFRNVILYQSKMAHSIGRAMHYYIFGLKSLKFSTTNHPPFRLYFIARNHTVLFLENISIFPAEALLSYFISLKYLIAVILFEGNTLKRLFFIFLGLKDAFLLKKDQYSKINQLRISGK